MEWYNWIMEWYRGIPKRYRRALEGNGPVLQWRDAKAGRPRSLLSFPRSCVGARFSGVTRVGVGARGWSRLLFEKLDANL